MTDPVPAGLPRRLGAMIYDGLLILALWMMTLTVLVALTNHAVVGPAVQSLLFIELFAFFAYFWVHKGQTLGMLAWRLTIRSTTGGPITYSQVMLRIVGALASIAALGIGYLWILFDPARRGWPDLFSDTTIYYTPRQPAG